jgi:hypothetical protein
MQIHQEMRSKLKELPASQLDALHLSAALYRQSLRGDDEIEVNEKMYDIARVETKNDQVIVYCLHDRSEDNLLVLLDEVLKNSTQDSQQSSSSLFQFSLLNFILPIHLTFERPSSYNLCHQTNYLIGDTSFVIFLNTPPPRG